MTPHMPDGIAETEPDHRPGAGLPKLRTTVATGKAVIAASARALTAHADASHETNAPADA